jgi:Tol biopolymer transport system component
MSDDMNIGDGGPGDRLERLYEEALGLPEEERHAFLDRVCADDPELRAELASLLAEGAAAQTFIEDLGRLVGPAGDGPPGRLVEALAHRYAIEATAGDGGMATVYRARDLRHERQVALKVLRPELAAIVGGERFLAEIKTTANLQHPNILPLFDSGEADGYLYYVMPYVEGESLRARLDREAQLPVDEAVRIATSMAEALDYAHRQGVIHRDIKPANVLLPDGKPVIADFGIALALSAGDGGRLTETGLSLGTPHYMSPEQATGDQHVGPATDIYALGCVLYEMLVAEPPFTGGTPQSVLGKIVSGEPDPVTRHRRSVPANVEAAIRKALEKVPADRFAEANDFARALGDPGFRHGDTVDSAAAGGGGLWKPLAVTLAGLTAMLTTVLVWSLQRPPPPGPVARFAVPFSDEMALPAPWDVSADGSLIVFEADGRLWVRRFSNLESSPIPGSEGGRFPSLSPDGELLAFTQSGQVRVAALDGSASRPVMEGQRPRWGRDYVYAATVEGLARVRAVGGAAEIVVRRRPNEAGAHIFVDEIPAGILFGVDRAYRHELQLLRTDTGEREPILSLSTGQRRMQLLPSGHLLYLDDNVLIGDIFDFHALQLAGQPVPLVEGVSWFFVADNGRLVYQAPGTAVEAEFIWVTRSGAVTQVDPGWSVLLNRSIVAFALSRDDRRLAFQDAREGNDDIWVRELPSGEPTRLTYDPAGDYVPRWGPDDASLTFVSLRGEAGLPGLWSLRTDRTGTPEELFSDAEEWLIMRTTPGGEASGSSVGGRDIIGLRPGVSDQPVELVASDWVEHQPELSPDGHWLAYMSNHLGGRREVFVRPFPDVDSAAPVQISLEGGIAPFWAHNGREIFFVEDSTRALMSVEFEASPASYDFRILDRRPVLTLPDDVIIWDVGQPYDLTRDDQTFLMLRTVGAPERPVLVVENWVQELYQRLPS